MTTPRRRLSGTAWTALLLGFTAAAADPSVPPGNNARAVADVLAGRRTDADASWWGFNGTNDTAALQAAINSGARRLVVPNLGRAWVVEPLFLAANQEIAFESGVVIAARPGAFLGKYDALFSAHNLTNLTLTGYGATFAMRKEDYRNPPYEKAEWRHCLSLRGCENVRVSGLRLAHSGGDGIYVGRGHGDGGPVYGRNIVIRDVVCTNNYRQGISVISVRDLLVENCVLSGTEGTPPQAGIDFEPNSRDEHLAHCVVRGCAIEDNVGTGVLIYLGNLDGASEPVSIRLEDCRIRGNARGTVRVIGPRDGGGPRGWVEIAGGERDAPAKRDRLDRLELRVLAAPAAQEETDRPWDHP